MTTVAITVRQAINVRTVGTADTASKGKIMNKEENASYRNPHRTSSMTVQTPDTEKRLIIYGPTGKKLVDKDTRQPFGFTKGEM